MTFTARSRAGALIVTGAAWLLFGILICEARYPGYTTTRMISDLGVGSTALLYNVSIFGMGVLLIAAAYLLYTTGTSRVPVILLALTGLGAAGVGIFPETLVVPHTIFALTAFLCGGLCALSGFRLFKAPWSWFSVCLGIITLAALVLLGSKTYLGLSAGGMERMIAYPIIVWGIGSGAYLMAPDAR